MDAYTCILCVHMSTYVLEREDLKQQEVFSHWIWVLRLNYSGPQQEHFNLWTIYLKILDYNSNFTIMCIFMCLCGFICEQSV